MTKLDLKWHEDGNDATCALEFRPATFGATREGTEMGMAYLPTDKKFNGVVYFDLAGKYDAKKIFTHEIGHLFGLEHSSSQDSLMFAHPLDASDDLTHSDLKALAKRHKLAGVRWRTNSSQSSPFLLPSPVKYFHGKLASM
jgi:Matrixin